MKWCHLVRTACEIIYEMDYAVNSKVVENLLQEYSLVPTALSYSLLFSVKIILIHCDRMLFQTNWHHLVLTCSVCSLWIYCTSSSLGSGRQFLFIYCTFWTARMQALNMNWIDGKYCLCLEVPGTYHKISFQEIPHFGVDDIRKITSNWSELKKMTAHDYEDMLQVGGATCD
jgi:hypothetical protein